MNIDIKVGIIQLSSNDNLKDNCRQLEYYFNKCVEKGANFILSPEVSYFISTVFSFAASSQDQKRRIKK